MCGRFASWADKNKILEHFGLAGGPNMPAGYNITPSDTIPAIRTSESARELITCHWGLIPHWAKDKKFSPINARAESLNDKPIYRDSFNNRRCLIPANGFYEWTGSKGQKQPWFIKLKNSEILAFAGLWSHWDKEGLNSCAIITTDANEIMKPIHHRMPVILSPDDYDRWLNEGGMTLLRPCSIAMEAYKVSPKVNNPKNQGPDLVQPLS